MKMIFTLTKNEYIKLFKRKSVPILLILLLLTVFSIPLIKSGDYGIYYGGSSREPYYKYQIPKEEINKYTNNHDKAYAYMQNYIGEQIEVAYKKAEEFGINFNPSDWRFETLQIITNLISQTGTNDYVDSGGPYSEYLSDNLIDDSDYILMKQKLDDLWKIIEENNYAESHRQNYEAAIKTRDNFKETLEKAQNESENTDDEDIEFKIFKLKNAHECYKKVIFAYDYLFENKYTYDSTEDKTFKVAINSYQQAANTYASLLSEKEFISDNNIDKYYDSYYYDTEMTYDLYYQKQLDNINEYKNKGIIALYSLENGVSELSVAKASRLKSLSFTNMFWFIAPLAIFFASGIVSKEFSTKTINLLLLRPVNRWKILLSKYLCILSLALGLTLVSFGLYLVGSGISLGFSDLLQPYMYVTGGEVITVNFILWLIGKIAIASIPVVFLISLTFMLSTVTKSTAVSIILSVLTLFSSILIIILFEILRIAERTYYPFPYFSMWSYVFDDVEFLNYNFISIFSGIIEKPNLLYGSIILLALAAISVVISFANFTRNDVK